MSTLAIDHPYYCSGSNFYSLEPGEHWETATEFLDNYESMDIDLNLVFRWDVHYHKDTDGNPTQNELWAEVFIIHQRKGIFAPHHIALVTPDELPRFRKYLENHWEKLQEMWKPIS